MLCIVNFIICLYILLVELTVQHFGQLCCFIGCFINKVGVGVEGLVETCQGTEVLLCTLLDFAGLITDCAPVVLII